jgi:capsular polysaccharide transport system permease protein
MFFAGWGIYILFAVGVAIFIGTLSERSELVDRVWQPVSYITIPISGTFFMVDWLPGSVHSIAALFPPVTAVELIRGGFFGPSVPIHTNIMVAVSSGMIFLCLGLWFMRDVRDYVEVN